MILQLRFGLQPRPLDWWFDSASRQFTVLQETEAVPENKSAAARSQDSKVGQTNPGKLKALLDANRRSSSYKKLLAERQRLPVYGYRDELLNVFRQENVFIIAGETGSGKSTQVPQFLLEVNIFFCLMWLPDW